MTEAFAADDSFAARDGGYEVTDATFDARVVVGDERWTLTLTLPTISAVVEGEVGDAVAEGWYETLQRRLEDVGGVTRGTVDGPAVTRDDGTVRVEFTGGGEDPAADARALVTFAEGTWFQGVIPGYDYEQRVERLRRRARQRG